VAVKIKLKRLGKIRAPYYRIVVADARTKRDGRAIEEIGKYHPKAEPSFIEVNSERAQHWLSVGAQPTDPVRKLLEITGDWQKYKGLPGAEGTLRTAEPKEDRKVAFAAALQETLDDSGATTKGGKSRPKAGDSAAKGGARSAKAGKADKPDAGQAGADKAASDKAEKAEKPAKPAKAETGKADTGKAEAAKADTGKAEAGKADTGKAEAGKADTGKAEAAKADTGKAEAAKTEASKTDTGKAEASKTEKADKAESADAAAAADSAPSEG
jgi:small subunit ribosomal protein S16